MPHRYDAKVKMSSISKLALPDFPGNAIQGLLPTIYWLSTTCLVLIVRTEFLSPEAHWSDWSVCAHL